MQKNIKTLEIPQLFLFQNLIYHISNSMVGMMQLPTGHTNLTPNKTHLANYDVVIRYIVMHFQINTLM